MASTPDIVLAPRTPTPPRSPTRAEQENCIPEQPSHTRTESYGLGLSTHVGSPLRQTSSISSLNSQHGPDMVYLSPIRNAAQHTRTNSIAVSDTSEPESTSQMPTPTSASTTFCSPNIAQQPYLHPFHSTTSLNNTPQNVSASGPFNFQPISMSKSPVPKSNISARRGHKYKHSSISANIFLEPPSRPVLCLPVFLPRPTLREARSSMTREQTLRFYWMFVHISVAIYVGLNAHGSAAMEALAHLIFYDSLGALISVSVSVLGNFDIWGRSTLRHPFGLQRIEVIAGFALSVLLMFFGFDLISHNLKHALEGLGSHEPHHAHADHEPLSAGSVDVTILIAIVATLISAFGLKNHRSIGRAMRFTALDTIAFSNLPLPRPLTSLLSNPSHFLTLSCSVTMLALPLLDLHTYRYIDSALALSIAFAMLALGVNLGKNVGGMLLQSYSGKGVDGVVQEIGHDPLVRKVESARFWQAHYGVGIADLKIRVQKVSSEDALVRFRERVADLIRSRLGGGYGKGGGRQKWEVSVEVEFDDGASGMSHSHSHNHGHSHSHSHGHSHGPVPVLHTH